MTQAPGSSVSASTDGGSSELAMSAIVTCSITRRRLARTAIQTCGSELAAPGFQPAAVYEALIANVAPGVPRRPAPADVRELLEWCEAPPSSAEVAEVLAIPISEARAQLREVATLDPVGADGFWRLPTA